MRQLVGIACLLLAGVVAAQDHAGSVVWLDVDAPALEGNLLDTPTVQRTAVWLPAGYERSAEKRYPVLYLLHGIFDTPEVWMRFFDLPGAMERALTAGRANDMIVVMPTGRNVLGGGFYLNSSVAGRWGDFVRHDLVSFVDARFRTDASREARAIAGHSMGGFGAVWHAMTSSDVFAVAFAMSPALLDDDKDVSRGNAAAWRGMLEMRGREGLDAALERRDMWPVAAWAVCTAFIPDPDDKVYLCDPPVRDERSELLPVEAALDRWARLLPVRSADEHVTALRSVDLALDYGIDDQFPHIPVTTQRLSGVLAELRVPHDLFVYRGDHRQQVKQRLETVVLPWVSGRLAAR